MRVAALMLRRTGLEEAYVSSSVSVLLQQKRAGRRLPPRNVCVGLPGSWGEMKCASAVLRVRSVFLSNPTFFHRMAGSMSEWRLVVGRRVGGSGRRAGG